MMISASAARTITLITTMMITAIIWSSFVFEHGPRGHGLHGQEHANDHPDNERDHGITSKEISGQDRAQPLKLTSINPLKDSFYAD